ncbi:unnamed protein product [Linum tenue]|uniref:Uncharacterized protein n=1 Tax=Linum tenue TaxID=586396 RepID=A0AAV0NIV6_9ROSI|nr:unnamed protein product [Linum tenue]
MGTTMAKKASYLTIVAAAALILVLALQLLAESVHGAQIHNNAKDIIAGSSVNGSTSQPAKHG